MNIQPTAPPYYTVNNSSQILEAQPIPLSDDKKNNLKIIYCLLFLLLSAVGYIIYDHFGEISTRLIKLEKLLK